MGKKATRENREKGRAEQPLPAPKDRWGALSPTHCKTILAIGFVFSIGVIYEWEPLNGLSDFTGWDWPYQDLGVFEIATALLLPFLLIAAVLWKSTQPRLALALITLSNFLLQLLSIAADPRGFNRVRQIVLSPDATAYFTDALRIDNLLRWLSSFHTVSLTGHSATHPAGPILFYYSFTRFTDPDTAALWAGLAVGLLGSLGVLAIYHFSSLWTQDPHTRLTAAALYALIPSLTVFFPEFDQAYPILSMALCALWVRTSTRRSFTLGLLLFASLMFTYTFLVLGAFFLFHAFTRLSQIRTMALASLIALSTCSLLYLLLWLLTGYNAPAAFLRSLSVQESFAAGLHRAYHVMILHDPYDFALGAGILAPLLIAFRAESLAAQVKAADSSALLSLCALATILTVDLTGLLRGEAARVWLFLMPLLIVPAAIQLARLAWSWRLSILAMQWWILVCLKAKMSFVEP